MRALVIGGTRFIGLHLVWELARQGHQVTIFNRGRSQAPLPEGVVRLYGDRRQPDQVREALAGREFEVVFDIIGYSGRDVELAVELFQGRVQHYIFISTTAVYAPSDYAPIEEDFPLNRRPDASLYAAGKVQCEDVLMAAYHRHRFPVTILRPAYVYGPDNNLYDREAGFFYRLNLGRPILVPLQGTFLFQHGHVDDLAAACLAVVGNRQALGQAYNITGPHAVTANGYVRTIAQAMGKEARIVYLPLEAMAALAKPVFPYGWQGSVVYSIEKARRELGWQPRYNLEEGHRQTYQWFLEQGMMDKLSYDFSLEDDLIAKYG